MAQRANLNFPNGTTYLATEVPLHLHNKTFYCTTPGCKAQMIHCNGGSNNAYFRSRRKSDHINISCIKNELNFNHHKYDEKSFNFEKLASRLIAPANTQVSNSSTATGFKHTRNVNNKEQTAIKSVATLYTLCLSLGKNASYNGYMINDILADDENYELYSNGIEGYKLVETSFYKYVDNGTEHYIIMNYPIFKPSSIGHVKLDFSDGELFEKIKSLIKYDHYHPVVVCGLWHKSINTDYHSVCNIENISQVYWPKF